MILCCHFCGQSECKILRRSHHELTYLHIHMQFLKNVSLKKMRNVKISYLPYLFTQKKNHQIFTVFFTVLFEFFYSFYCIISKSQLDLSFKAIFQHTITHEATRVWLPFIVVGAIAVGSPSTISSSVDTRKVDHAPHGVMRLVRCDNDPGRI